MFPWPSLNSAISLASSSAVADLKSPLKLYLPYGLMYLLVDEATSLKIRSSRRAILLMCCLEMLMPRAEKQCRKTPDKASVLSSEDVFRPHRTMNVTLISSVSLLSQRMSSQARILDRPVERTRAWSNPIPPSAQALVTVWYSINVRRVKAVQTKGRAPFLNPPVGRIQAPGPARYLPWRRRR